MAGNEVTFSTYDANGAATVYVPGIDDWGGIRFQLAGCSDASYGYLGSVMPPSNVSHAVIEHAKIAIEIEGRIAPTITDVTFARDTTGVFTNDFDIVLSGWDVVVPYGWCSGSVFNVDPAEWRLEAPTRVSATQQTYPNGDLSGYGEVGEVDLIVQGKLFTDNADQGAEEVVSFTPLENELPPHPLMPPGDADWGGIMLDYLSAGSVIEDAEICFADNPLFIYYPDSLTTVRNSSVHHFWDTGIWVQQTLGQGAVIESTHVFRGTDDVTLGTTGVFLDKTDQMTFRDNRIEMTGEEDPPELQGGRGLYVHFGKTFCLTQGPQRLFSVTGNTFVGPGYTVSEDDATFSGFYADWICGSAARDINITNNLIYDWNTAGLDFYQSSDVDVSCNRIELNWRDVNFFRDSQSTGPEVRLKSNRIQVAGDARVGVRTQNTVKIKLGPQTATTGENEMRTNNLKSFILENQTGVHLDLNAEKNHWFINNVEKSNPAEVDVPPYIDTEIGGSIVRVDVDSLLYGGAPPPCWPPSEQGDPDLALARLSEGGQPEERSGREDAAARSPAQDLPAITELGSAFPNPGRSGVSIPLAVSQERAGRFEVVVYDVLGRRAATILDRAVKAGQHLLEWDGRGAEGRPVGAGIYFLRVSGPQGFLHTSKLVLLER